MAYFPRMTVDLATARRFSVAPMMDWTDRHCRYLHRLLSASGLLFTEMVTSAAVVHGRREQLLGYLGEAYEPPCDACDRCRSSDGPPTVDTDEADDLGPGTPVVHPQWGDGEVVSLEPPDAVVVVFETAGYRTLSLPLVRERELLHPRRSARGAADRPG